MTASCWSGFALVCWVMVSSVLGLEPGTGLRPLIPRALRRRGITVPSDDIRESNKNKGTRRVVTRLDSSSALADAAAIQGFNAAFVGGVTGVMGVMFALELQKVTMDKRAEGCPYCMGNGEILCGICRGNGRCAPDGERCNSDGSCDLCDGRGLVQCINCKGDGRLIPIVLQNKATRDPEFSPDAVSLDAP
jgi:hypothetical protein